MHVLDPQRTHVAKDVAQALPIEYRLIPFTASCEDDMTQLQYPGVVTMGDIRRATLAARERTGRNIGTQAGCGTLQVVVVDFPPEKKGRSVVTPLSAPLSPLDAFRFLNMVQP